MNKYIRISLIAIITLQPKALLCSQKNTPDYQKLFLRDFIINSSYDAKSAYLAKLLHINRDDLEKKFNTTLAEYLICKKELQENIANPPFLTDITKSKAKIKQLSLEIDALLQHNRYAYETQKKLMLLTCEHGYLTWLEKEKEYDYDINITYKNTLLKKMSLLAQALYLVSFNEEDLVKNSAFFRKTISLLFHPDKTINDEEIDFFKDTSPLLQNNEKNDAIITVLENINKKNDAIIEKINNPSIAKTIGFMATDITLPYFAQGLGNMLGHMTLGQVMPNSAGADKASNMCVHTARKTALKIESVLIKHVYKL